MNIDIGKIRRLVSCLDEAYECSLIDGEEWAETELKDLKKQIIDEADKLIIRIEELEKEVRHGKLEQ